VVDDRPQPSSNGHHNFRREDSSVGIVQRQYQHFKEPLQLRSGAVLPEFTLAYETYGTLNAERSNAILICHALSGDAHVAGYHTDDPSEAPGWWDDAVGPGKMFDTDRFFVICSNVIGGCQGSTGPSSLTPDGSGIRYGLRFPVVTVADMVQAQARLMDRLGIECLFSAAGGSMGAMQALQWAVDFPDRVSSVLFLASTARSSTQNVAWNAIGREAIYADPRWNKGDYYDGPAPDGGLGVARMVGHITYMCETSLERKFGRRLQGHEKLPYTLDGAEFAIEGYLQHQGEKFVQRFDANSYLYITKALDYFDVSEDYDYSLKEALRQTRCPFLVVSFSSDWLYPPEASLDLVTALEELRYEVEYHHVEAFFGHDSFLVEVETMTRLVGNFLHRLWQQREQTEPPPTIETQN